MSAEETLDENDRYAAHMRRNPLPGAGIRIILLTELAADSAARIIEPIVAWLQALGRPSLLGLSSSTGAPHG